jgi:penicillin-binding protein 1A
LAVAGGVGQKTGSRVQNYATDTRRPAGSTIKPLGVYAPALEDGLINWASLYEDEPLRSVGGNPWPHNADGRYRGHVTVREAMAQSINTVAVRVLEEVGVERSFAFLHDTLQMRSLQAAPRVGQGDLTVSSLALGQHTAGVSVRELTAGYTAFVGGDGYFHPAISYTKVLDGEGRVLLENKVEGTRALSRENAYIMTRLLMTVTEDGTAKDITLTERTGIEAAGKTGTTQNNCDRWFVGYTPRLLAGVWMGYDLPRELRGIERNPCVGIWDDLMTACEEIYGGAPPRQTFDTPASVIPVTYCRASGRLPSFNCVEDASTDRLEVGWFVRGREPQEFCELHRPIPLPEESASENDSSNILPESAPLPIPEWQTAPHDPTPPAERHPRWFRWHNPWARRIE